MCGTAEPGGTESLSTRLPQEVIDMIIYRIGADEDSWDHKASLKNCSLVSRAWLSASRAELFHSIDFYTFDDVRSFASVLKHSPQIAECVRWLEISCVHEDEDGDGRGHPRSRNRRAVNAAYNMLERTCSLLNRVETLVLIGTRLKYRLPLMRSVEGVEIRALTIDDPDLLIRLFDSLPQATELTIHHANIPYDLPATQMRRFLTRRVSAASLKTLELHNCDLNVYRLFLSLPLKYISFMPSAPASLEEFCPIFRDSPAAASLADMQLILLHELDIQPPTTPSSHFASLLSKSTALVHLRFESISSLSWIIAILSSVPQPSNLSSITINSGFGNPEELEQLEAVLSAAHFPRLDSVLLEVRKHTEARSLEDRLPGLHSRGILDFEC